MSDGSDYFPSPSPSDPVSDVNQDEMDQLMADLSDMDNDIFKSDKKRASAKNASPENTKNNKKVSFQKFKNVKDNDDWDGADDLLQSDEEKEKVKGKSSKPSTTDAHVKSSVKASPKADKTKLLSDLFNDSKENDGNFSANKSTPEKVGKKNKQEISFDDETELLNMNSKNKHSDKDFLDTLLGSENTSLKPAAKSSAEFVLPDRYKKSTSPEKDKQARTSSDPLDDLFGDVGSRPRRRMGQRSSKPVSIEEDDILSGKANKTDNVISHEGTESKLKDGMKTAKQADWLFASPKGTPSKGEGQLENKPISAPIEHESTVASTSEKGDWLNNLLTSSKGSPSTHEPKKSMSEASLLKKEASKPDVDQTHSFPQDQNLTKEMVITNPHSRVASVSDIQNELVGHKARLEMQQQQEREAQLLQQYQVQMQEQQQRMMQMIMQQKQMTIPSLPIGNNSHITFEDEETIKKLKIDLHKAETGVGKVEAELSLLKEQHDKEIEMINESHKKKETLEEEIRRRRETNSLEEREALMERHETIVNESQKEKAFIAASYEAQLSAVKEEMSDALHRSKEMYATLIDRLKREHQNAIERLTELKDTELKAALSAVERTREVDFVLDQLESNTAKISEVTNDVSERHKSSLELVKRSLELKEKQLKDMEANLGVMRAESESERNRLTVLVNRLENTLANQGSEIESHKWNLAQEKMKVDVERNSLMEEKRHFRYVMESERKELDQWKERMLKEQKEVLQIVAKQKSQIMDLENRRSKNLSKVSSEMEVLHHKEERKILQQKIDDLKIKREEMREEENILEAKKLKLNEEIMKNNALKESIDQKLEDIRVRSKELEMKEKKMEEYRKDLHKKLSEITQTTQALHLQKDSLLKERARLEVEHEEATKRLSQGLCFSCSSKVRWKSSSVPPFSLDRIPGDGSEMHVGKLLHESPSQKALDPASVLQRLKQARDRESRMKQQKLELMSISERRKS